MCNWETNSQKLKCVCNHFGPHSTGYVSLCDSTSRPPPPNPFLQSQVIRGWGGVKAQATLAIQEYRRHILVHRGMLCRKASQSANAFGILSWKRVSTKCLDCGLEVHFLYTRSRRDYNHSSLGLSFMCMYAMTSNVVCPFKYLCMQWPTPPLHTRTWVFQVSFRDPLQRNTHTHSLSSSSVRSLAHYVHAPPSSLPFLRHAAAGRVHSP